MGGVLLLGVISGLLAALCGVSLGAVFHLSQPRSLASMPPTITPDQNGWSSAPSLAFASTAAVPSAQATAGVLTTSQSPAASIERGLITIETFGFSYGAPPRGCKFVADVRNIHAGSFAGSGRLASVQKQVMAKPAAKAWEEVFITQWVPVLKNGDKVAIGCAIGHHRSVAMAVVLARDLRARGFKARLINRDLKKAE